MEQNSSILRAAIDNTKEMNQKLAAAFSRFEQTAKSASFSLSVLIVAAEKQVPYRPFEVYVSGGKVYECKCGAHLTEKTAYCKDCGQRLEWGEGVKDWPPYLDLPKK